MHCTLSDQILSVVCRRCCCKLFRFHFLLQNQQANFNQTLYKASLGKGGSKPATEEQHPFLKGDDNKIPKKYRKNLKIFSKTTQPISTKLGSNHLRMIGIQFYTNERPHPFPREDNYKLAKKHFENLPLQNHWAYFNLTRHKASLGGGNSSFYN